MKTINNILQIKKRNFRVAESTWLRKGWRLAQVVGFFSALGLLWILVSSTSVQAFIYKAVVPEKSTFSIVAVDPLTGDVGIAGASCVPISAAGMTALVPGQGASATQAAAFDPKQRMQIFNMIQQGATATEIIDFVGDESYDASNGIRQYGVVTLNGGRIHVAGFTGNQTEEWSGDRQNLTMAVSTQGNTLEGPHVVSDALAAFTAIDIGPVAFPDRLLRALEAASAAGGDRRCNGDGIQQTAQAAFIAVSRADQPPFAAIMGRNPSPMIRTPRGCSSPSLRAKAAPILCSNCANSMMPGVLRTCQPAMYAIWLQSRFPGVEMRARCPGPPSDWSASWG